MGVVLGAAIELVLLSRLRSADIDTTMLVMIGAWIAMQNTEQLVWSGVAKSINIAVPVLAAGTGPVSVSWTGCSCSSWRWLLIAASLTLINRTSSATPCAPPSRTATPRR